MPSNIKKETNPRTVQRQRQKARRRERTENAAERLAGLPISFYQHNKHKFVLGQQGHAVFVYGKRICKWCEQGETDPIHEFAQVKLV